MKFFWRLILLGLVGLGNSSPALAVAAPRGITVTHNTPTLDFPHALTFAAQFASPNPIEAVTLYYGTNATACQSIRTRQRIEDLAPSATLTATWEWDWSATRSLPPGAEVWWEWEVQDSAGEILRTPRETLLIVDDSHDWKKVAAENVTIYWEEGNRAFAEAVLADAVEGLGNLTTNAGVAMTQPVQIWVYPSASGVRAAIPNVPEWTGGVAFPEYRTIVAGIDAGNLDWAAEIVPHELAHLVTGAVIANCYGVYLPTWLEEGLAVYAEGPVTRASKRVLQTALSRGTVPTLRDLTHGFSAYSDRAHLDYVYSGEVVRFLLTEYEVEQMTELLGQLSNGVKIDLALQEVYGFDTAGLEARFYKEWDFPPPTAEPTTQASITRTPIATLVVNTPTPPATPTAPATATPQAVAQVTATASPAPTATAAPTAPPATSAPLPCLGLIFALALGATRLRKP